MTLKEVRTAVIGEGAVLDGPFGPRGSCTPTPRRRCGRWPSSRTSSAPACCRRYVLTAVHLLAREGWKLLPLYRFDPDTGLWRHRAAKEEPARLDWNDAEPPATAPDSVLPGQRAATRRILGPVGDQQAIDPALSDEFERIRWFPLPSEGRVGSRDARRLARRGRARPRTGARKVRPPSLRQK